MTSGLSARAPERHYELELPVGRLAVCEWGSVEKPALLMLHGWLDNAGSFFTLAPLLAKSFRCVAFDFPGHGRSAHLGENAQYHFVDGVLAIHAVLDALGLGSVVLIGHSMGGALGALYSGSFSERVSAFISIEAFGPLVRDAAESHQQLREACESRLARKDSRKSVYRSAEQALSVRAMAGDVSRELLLDIVQRNLSVVDDGWQWSSDARLRLPSLLRMTAEQVNSFLVAIACPVLVIQASKGMSFVPKALQAQGRSVKHLHVVQLDGGHHVHLESPLQVATVITEFLQASKVNASEC